MLEPIVGRKFGMLEVVELVYAGGNRGWNYKCKCDCGNLCIRTKANLQREGSPRNCGCSIVYKRPLTDLKTGDVKGLLTIVEFAYTRNSSKYYTCKCECGTFTTSRAADLNNGNTRSCGHLVTPKKEHTKESLLRLESKRQWVQAVKKRDSFQCVRCESTLYLHAHHINSFSHYPEQRNDIDNGITLCEICHTSFHSRYTKTNFTKEDLVKFLSERK